MRKKEFSRMTERAQAELRDYLKVIVEDLGCESGEDHGREGNGDSTSDLECLRQLLNKGVSGSDPAKGGMTLRSIMIEAYTTARDKGWYDDGLPPIPERLALIHSEVSEALEDYRNPASGGTREESLRCLRFEGMDGELPGGYRGKPCGFPSELADILIRVCDLAEAQGIDLEEAVRMKMAYNKTRPHRHGGKVC